MTPRRPRPPLPRARRRKQPGQDCCCPGQGGINSQMAGRHEQPGQRLLPKAGRRAANCARWQPVHSWPVRPPHRARRRGQQPGPGGTSMHSGSPCGRCSWPGCIAALSPCCDMAVAAGQAEHCAGRPSCLQHFVTPTDTPFWHPYCCFGSTNLRTPPHHTTHDRQMLLLSWTPPPLLTRLSVQTHVRLFYSRGFSIGAALSVSCSLPTPPHQPTRQPCVRLGRL